MNLKFFNLAFNLTVSLILGTIVLFYNISKIPSGDEMGAIGEFFIATSFAIFIYFSSVVVSIVAWKAQTDNRSIVQLVLLCLCVSLIYYSSWKICVFRTPPLTIAEVKELKIRNTKEFYNFYHQIPQLIHDGYSYKPSDRVFSKDSLFILNSLKSLIGKPFQQIDSLSKVKIANFLGYRTGFFFENSLEIPGLLQTIAQSIKVRNIFYSPLNQSFLTFISYETGFTDNKIKIIDSGEAMALIGYKQENKMVFYRYYKLDSYLKFIVNDNLAYSYCFKNAIGRGIYPERYPNFLTKTFWNTEKVLKNTKYSDRILYGFEAYIPYNEKEYKLIDPILILQLNQP